MFRGEAQHGMDLKGRTVIPQRYREHLGDKFVITKGLDNCLFLFPFDEYMKIEKKISAMPISDPTVRQFVRFFVGGAVDTETDAQGRFVVPQNLRKHAFIDKEVVFVGAITRLEMWASELYNAEEPGDAADMAEKLAEFGL